MGEPLAPTVEHSEAAAAAAPGAGDVAVWDPLLRLTHWSFALLIPLMWWTAETSRWGLHRRLGLVLLGLLLFRLLWGVLGPETARFAAFVKGPGAVLAYLRGRWPGAGAAIGHSPLGGWATMVLLGAMLFQVSLGLFAGDPYDGMTGPLNPLVGVLVAQTMTEIHETFFWVIAGLIAVHLTAIAFYAVVRRNDLVTPMVSGARPALAGIRGIGPMPWARGLIAVGLAAGLAGWIAAGAPPLT